MRKRAYRLVAIAAAVPLLLGVAACSDDKGGVPQSRGAMISEIAAALESEDDLGFDGEQAECVAEAVVDEIGFERLRDELGEVGGDFEDIENEEITAEVGLAMFGAMLDCGADLGDLTGE